MVDEVRVEKDRTHVEAHLFDTERAREVERMVEGGLRNVSTRYRVHRVEEQPKTQTSHVREWEPLEYSIVTIPADPTVGLGRSAESGEQFEVRMVRASSPADSAATTEVKRMADGADASAGVTADPTQTTQTRVEHVRDAQLSPADMEKGRIRAIDNLCKMNKLDDKYRQMFITSGDSLEQVSDHILLRSHPAHHRGARPHESGAGHEARTLTL
jgi:hypothetical protein